MSNIFVGTTYLVLASVLWGMVHSFLASHTVKNALRGLAGAPAFDRMYRFSYNLFAFASFYPIGLMLYTFPDQSLYTIPSPWIYLTTVLQGIAVFLMVAPVMHTGLSEFLGLEQLTQVDEPKPRVLLTDGLYAFMRHPLYTGILLFIWLIPEMTVNRLALIAALTVYIFIGAWFEERKLLKDFGPAYAEYKARTPMLFPQLIGANRKS